MTGVPAAISRAAVALCILAVRAYQVTLGPLMGGQCRFHPSCSFYAIDAYREWGAIRGTWLTIRRLARCHPLGGSGLDPVPANRSASKLGTHRLPTPPSTPNPG